jgi:hypothetical protein
VPRGSVRWNTKREEQRPSAADVVTGVANVSVDSESRAYVLRALAVLRVSDEKPMRRPAKGHVGSQP